jgi:hypothetical protein
LAHRTHPDFWVHYHRLPHHIQELADRTFELLKQNPRHPSIRFKRVGQYWSARVGRNYRAVAIEVDDGVLWTWIGTHDDYDSLLRS